MQIHKNNLKFILIEGQKAKILLTPLKNSDNITLNRIIEAQELDIKEEEFFIGISTHPLVNLGGIFFKTRQSLAEIKKSLILSGESFKPPLQHFNENELKKIYDSFNISDDLIRKEKMNNSSFTLSSDISTELERNLKELGDQISELIDSYIILEGGYIIAHNVNNQYQELFSIDSKATMSNSLFLTAEKCAWFLKKMHVDSILLECTHYFQFIHRLNNAVLSLSIAKGKLKLGFLRLIIPKYCDKINEILDKVKSESTQTQQIIDIKSMISELLL